MTGEVLSPGGSLSSKQLQRMVTALDLASDKNAEISALEAELLQAKSKAVLYEVCALCPAGCCGPLVASGAGNHESMT